MRDAPAFLVVKRGKETVVGKTADLDNRTLDTFLESFLITDFLEESGVCNEDKLLGEDFDFEDTSTTMFSRQLI
jgi:hypothetical protein